MQPLRILSVTFDTHLDPWDLPKFRGAIARKVGLEHEWFHNHDNENGGYHQRYPLIQYKLEPQRVLEERRIATINISNKGLQFICLNQYSRKEELRQK